MMSSHLSLKSAGKPGTHFDNKKVLFDAYEEADREVAIAKQIYEAALLKRSGTVKAIHDSHGKGPFNFRGGVTVVIRKNNTTKELTYFFRERSKKELEGIDE